MADTKPVDDEDIEKLPGDEWLAFWGAVLFGLASFALPWMTELPEGFDTWSYVWPSWTIAFGLSAALLGREAISVVTGPRMPKSRRNAIATICWPLAYAVSRTISDRAEVIVFSAASGFFVGYAYLIWLAARRIGPTHTP